jgi:hypothetical protein
LGAQGLGVGVGGVLFWGAESYQDGAAGFEGDQVGVGDGLAALFEDGLVDRGGAESEPA